MIEFLQANKTTVIQIFLILYVIISVLVLLLYIIDKLKAKNYLWRIPEFTLLIAPWLFGSLGGILGVFLIRHKSKHWYFIISNIFAFIAHIILLIYLLQL
ncbi:MAG: DUF1294 domain-containing protein [Erysipelotrichaceae bacterium]|nr:DUF1294 domain-containing protein [Erysipelotrichaceae bacterium]